MARVGRMIPESRHRRGKRARSKRGVAMLLVIISVMTATVLAMSYLSSRDNSAAIGHNVIESAEARWSAVSGLELALATLQTEVDWRTLHTNGILLENYAIGDATVTVELIDMDTGLPPDQDSIFITLIARASTERTEQTATVMVTVTPAAAGVIQLDLADFALLTEERIRMRDRALVTRWSRSPRTPIGLPVRLATADVSDDSIYFSHDALLVNGRIYYSEDASSRILRGDHDADEVEMADRIPIPAPPDPGVAEPDGTDHGHLNYNGHAVIAQQTRWSSITVPSSNGRVTISDGLTVVVDNDLVLQQNSRLNIEGDVTLVVFGDVELRAGSSIELRSGASLRIFVGGHFTLTDAYVGDLRDDRTVRDISGRSPWFDTNRLRLFTLDADTSSPRWELDEQSVVKASIYAPHAEVRLNNSSAIYGRIVANEIRLQDNAAMFYCHMLDSRSGYSNRASGLFDDDGRVRSSIQDIERLDSSELASLAETYGVQFLLFGERIGNKPQLVDPSHVSSGDPTPRPVQIEYELLSFGMVPSEWEYLATSTGDTR